MSTIKTMVDTMASDKPAMRRNYSEALKAQVMAECEAPGASVAKVALAHGINATRAHRLVAPRWVNNAERLTQR